MTAEVDGLGVPTGPPAPTMRHTSVLLNCPGDLPTLTAREAKGHRPGQNWRCLGERDGKPCGKRGRADSGWSALDALLDHHRRVPHG